MIQIDRARLKEAARRAGLAAEIGEDLRKSPASWPNRSRNPELAGRTPYRFGLLSPI
jgi:hypothetical protein